MSSTRSSRRQTERGGQARGWSLRRRLLALLFMLTAALFCFGAIQNWRANQEASNRLFDDSLRESAGLLLQLAQHEIAEHGQMLGIELLKAETRPGPYSFRFQIWTPDMQAGYRSAAVPAVPLLPFQSDGFGWTQIDGQQWRAYSVWNSARTLQIQIAQPQALRQQLDRDALWRAASALSVLLLLAGLLIWLAVTASFRSLQITAASVGERSEQDLRPIDAPDAPSEVQPLIAALNRLLQRIRTALQRERSFTADAAHELRTPLAAIRANAQVLVGARDAAEREATARDLLASVDRGTRLIEQLLALARADQSPAADAVREVDLAEVAREQVVAHQSQADQCGVGLTAKLDPSPVRADPALMSVLVRNLIDNALRYTPSGGRIEISTGLQSGQPTLQVVDDGPGIPGQERERAFERFHRLGGRKSTGSGLGLSIVQRVAEVHGGSVDIAPGLSERGTRVRVTFHARAA